MRSLSLSLLRIAALSVFSCVVGFSASLQAQQGKVEQELMQLERDWCTASLKNDPAMLGRILADDYTSVGRDGKLTNKAADLASVKTNKVTACDVDMMQVRVYGDAAVVVGRTAIKGTEFSGQVRWTDTFVRRDGRWQCVATQSSEIKP